MIMYPSQPGSAAVYPPTSQPQPDTDGRRRRTYQPDDPLLSPREAAAERGQAISTFWRDVKRGMLPPAIYVNPKSPRWRRSELRAALEACRVPRAAKQNP